KIDRRVNQTVAPLTSYYTWPIIVSVNGTPNYGLAVLWVERWEIDMGFLEWLFPDFTGNHTAPGVPVDIIHLNLSHPQPNISLGEIGDYAFAVVYSNGNVTAYHLYGDYVIWSQNSVANPKFLRNTAYTDDDNDDALVANSTHVFIHDSINGTIVWLKELGNITDMACAHIYNTPSKEIIFLNGSTLVAYDPIGEEKVFSKDFFAGNISLAWFNKTLLDSPDIVIYNQSIIKRAVIRSIPFFSNFEAPSQISGLFNTMINITVTDMEGDLDNSSVKMEIYLANGSVLLIDPHSMEGNIITTTFHFNFPALNETTTAIIRVRANDSEGYFERTSNKSIFIDAVAPTLLWIQKNPEQPRHDQSITIRANITDNSNVSEAKITVPDRGINSYSMIRESSGTTSDGVWVVFRAEIPAAFAPEREIAYYILASDPAGNTLNYSSSYISNTLPAIITFSWRGSVSQVNSTWIREGENVEFLLSVNDPDNQTGNTAQLYINDGSGWVSYEMSRVSYNYPVSNFSYTLPGTWSNSTTIQFYFRAIDTFNNTDSATRSFTIDGSPPWITDITFSGTTLVNTTYGETKSIGVGRQWGVSINTMDYGSGYSNATLYYTYEYFNGSIEGPYIENFITGRTANHVGTNVGWCNITIEVRDVLGNSRNYSYLILVDDIPEIISHGSVEQYPSAYGFTLNVTGRDINMDDITVSLTYRFDSGPTNTLIDNIPYGEGFVLFGLSTDDTRTLYYWINMSDGYAWKIYGPYSLVVDGRAPTITKVDAPTMTSYAQSIIIKITASDDHSGVNMIRIFYQINGGEWQVVNAVYSAGSWSATIPAPGTLGILTWFCEVSDRAGNAVNSTTQNITLRSMPPTVTIERRPDWVYANDKVSISLIITDPENESVIIIVSIYYPDGTIAYTKEFSTREFEIDLGEFANVYGAYL
ncbi:MAG: hypothetical protein QXR13_03140, partial [Candidatus Bathyarchaeia archaeon]